MVGERIGKYRVTRQVGRGGMGTVYAAVDELLHREVAIKVLNAGLEDPTVARRFHAEAIAVARLNHPGIAAIYELFEHDGQQLMVMEFVRGETLESVLSMGHLDVDRAVSVVLALLEALAHAHGLGVVHRDLKPANLILTADDRVKVTDFGIARVVGAEQLTAAGFMMGTPSYMAPEQVLGQPIDGRTDLYTVALVFFQMLSGELPFKRGTAMQVAQARLKDEPVTLAALRPDLPGWCGLVIDRALARNPDHRFQTAGEFIEAIERAHAGQAVPSELRPAFDTAALAAADAPAAAGPSRISPPLPMPVASAGRAAADQAPPAIRRPTVLAAGAALVLAVALGAWWMFRDSTPEAVTAAVMDAPAAAPEVGALSPESAGAGASTSEAGVPADSAAPVPGAGSAATPDAGPVPAGADPVPALPTDADRAGEDAPTSNLSDAETLPASEAPATVAAIESAAGEPGTSVPRTVTFRGVRGFIVNGDDVDEPDAGLTVAPDEVRLTDEGGANVFEVLPAASITSAAYTRARNPRWYPTLSGPPVGIDMPGGIFRGRYHWLSLQSRDNFIIVRMNDNDWERITGAVSEILGLEIHQLDPP